MKKGAGALFCGERVCVSHPVFVEGWGVEGARSVGEGRGGFVSRQVFDEGEAEEGAVRGKRFSSGGSAGRGAFLFGICERIGEKVRGGFLVSRQSFGAGIGGRRY